MMISKNNDDQFYFALVGSRDSGQKMRETEEDRMRQKVREEEGDAYTEIV